MPSSGIEKRREAVQEWRRRNAVTTHPVSAKWPRLYDLEYNIELNGVLTPLVKGTKND